MDLFVFIVVGLAGSIIAYLVIDHQRQVDDAAKKTKEEFDKKWVVAKRAEIQVGRGVGRNRKTWTRTVVIQKHPDSEGLLRAYMSDNGTDFVAVSVEAAIEAIGAPE